MMQNAVTPLGHTWKLMSLLRLPLKLTTFFLAITTRLPETVTELRFILKPVPRILDLSTTLSGMLCCLLFRFGALLIYGVARAGTGFASFIPSNGSCLGPELRYPHQHRWALGTTLLTNKSRLILHVIVPVEPPLLSSVFRYDSTSNTL